MRRRGLLTLAALVGGAGVLWAAAPAPSAKKAPAIPERIVSINLCADQLVLALADREQIAGLTRNATDPQMPGGAAKGWGIPMPKQSDDQKFGRQPTLSA